MPAVRYLPDDIEVDAAPGETLLEAAVRAGVPHSAACGGEGRCSTCRVLVVSGAAALSPRTTTEIELVGPLAFGEDLRLACQTSALGAATVRRLVIDADDLELFDRRRIGAPGRIGRECAVAVLVADIRGFTAFSERLLPYDVVHLLNRVFAFSAEIVERHDGRIGTYLGDGFMAVFERREGDDEAWRALQAARELLEQVDRFQPYAEDLYGQGFGFSIGVHTGVAVVGAVGAGEARVVTAIGDVVNTASRVEHANRVHNTRLLVSDEARHLLGDRVVTRALPPVELAGKTGEHVLHEVVDD